MSESRDRESAYRQGEWKVRFDWGLTGARAIAADAAAVVVVDVLSFTTSVSVAVDAGIVVYPYCFRDASAAAFAASRSAMLAVGRREAGPTDVSLSPASIRRAVSSGVLTRGGGLVLPSPNGSTIASSLPGSAPVVASCLRNAPAVGQWLSQVDGPVSVVAAGERWTDDSLRPAVEDLWGAGAVIAGLTDASDDGAVALSPEASTAAAAFREVLPTLRESLMASASGQELVTGGFSPDVAVAAEYAASSAVPVLVDGAFHAA